jgi:hypothetical protein
VTRPLVKSGAVSDVDILRLERDVSRMRGERDQAAAQISRVQAAITEAEGKIQEVELAVRNQWRAELSETMSKLGSLSEARAGWRTGSSMPRSVRRCAARSSACWSTPWAAWCSRARKWSRSCRSTTR